MFCQKVCWRIMPEHYNTKIIFEGLRGKLCCDFAGGLQLSIKVLTQTAYPIYRVVIQRFLTVYVKFRRYVPELSINCNGERIHFSGLKIGGTVSYCLIIIFSLVANSLIVMIVCETPNLKKPINYFIANMGSSDLLYPVSINYFIAKMGSSDLLYPVFSMIVTLARQLVCYRWSAWSGLV